MNETRKADADETDGIVIVETLPELLAEVLRHQASDGVAADYDNATGEFATVPPNTDEYVQECWKSIGSDRWRDMLRDAPVGKEPLLFAIRNFDATDWSPEDLIFIWNTIDETVWFYEGRGRPCRFVLHSLRLSRRSLT